MTSTVSDTATIVKTSMDQVLAAVTATTKQAKYAMLKPFAQAIATAVRSAILAVAVSARTVGAVLTKLVPLLMGFLSNLLSLSGISTFARDVLGRLT